MKKKFSIYCLLACVHFYVHGQSPVKRTMQSSDIYRLSAVGDAQVSPDGKWVAYTLSNVDSAKDKRNVHIWMVSWDGKEDIQLTSSTDDETKPRWSPDGKYLSFLSSRNNIKDDQLWLMDRRGGEGKKITEIKGEIKDYAWSPDGKKVLLTIRDKEPEDTSKSKTTKPYVIDRYQYKQDIEGYRHAPLHTHLYLLDPAIKKLDTVTAGNYDEGSAEWNPEGSQIAFVSNRTEDPDKNENTDIYIVDAKPRATIKQITTWTGSDDSPQWSPDGKSIAYTRSTSNSEYFMYDQPVLCVVPNGGGEPKLLSKSLDRPFINPKWTKDGKSILGLIQDDRQQYVGSFSVADGQLTKIADGQRAFININNSGDNWVVTMSEPQLPGEIYAIENGKTRRLTTHAEDFVAPISFANVEGFSSKSSDGTIVSGILYKPANAVAGQKLPLILFIHGGPVSQDDYGFDLTRQMLAAKGYAVAAVNYRGSNGRGLDFCKVISGDWGNKEVIDLHGAVDYLIKQGIADPDRLAVGGWSYGGILTDYLIASDTRFKAACSGAGTGFTLSLFGVDQYIRQYNNEIGPPWKNMNTYIKISYPLLKADKIKTPTLFLVGEKDFNVPSAGSEQMYQALRTTGIATELIVYPGQFHGISVPSYQKDRFERYLAWYDKYLKKGF